MRTCTKCQEIKDSTEFYSSKRDGLMPSCKVCHSKVTKAWKESNPDRVKLLSKKWDKLNAGKRSKTTKIWEKLNPDRVKNKSLLNDYGITLSQYNQMLLNQHGTCKICNQEETAVDKRNNKIKSLAVDHCHETGEVRGLLCSNCNRGIGHLQDSTELLEKAINYLKGHYEKN